MGEGWGEGGDAGKVCAACEVVAPLSPTLSREGRGSQKPVNRKFSPMVTVRKQSLSGFKQQV